MIVEAYIKTAKPVGSKLICKELKLSSATIRNEMSGLENLGYLEKNHVSSGRIPSELGYKYYVDNLMKPKELSGEDILKLQTIFSNHDLKVSDTITKCMEIISDLTNYTSIVLGKSSSDNFLQQVTIIPLNDNKVVALICTNNGNVFNRQVSIEKNVNITELVKICEIINKMLIGTQLDEINQRLEFEIKPIIAQTVTQYEAVYNVFCDAFSNFSTNPSTDVHFAGKTNILKQPEYDNVEQVKEIINKFEDENLVKKIESKSDGINIYIGEDSEFDPNVTVIKSKYNMNGEEGTIAIVGPKRMEYDKVVGLLTYLNDNLNEKVVLKESENEEE